jgi:threonine aldolase
MRNILDFRSDTVTVPTDAMRRAMAAAEVGDDVFGDDPTVKRLEERTAEILGKEAALFVVSGTMSNQVALKAHTQPGDEVLLDANSHMYYYEAGGPAALSGVMCRCLPGKRGIFTAADVEEVLRPPDVHFAPTRLVCVENTHNRGGGSIWPMTTVHEVAGAARKHGLKLHMDGARIWNASIAAGIAEKEYAAPFDSVSVCFSKGLGAPVGSALAGSAEFIQRARRVRKLYGGGMRQAGIIAAGALHALEHHRARLAEDHAHAQRLAEALSTLDGIELDKSLIQTNLLWFRIKGMPASVFCSRLKEAGVLMLPLGPDVVRAVTHLNVDAQAVDRAVEIIKSVRMS